ncbi:hypothetical protein NRY95_03630 [Xanthomonas campestris pv. phormiicola]|nr:hypothetical protein [Xanthomonas campestris pv. phormiicola]UYC17072.1 hypothetical protein NRY95_03630 [Xanthomonas campestris pv. phormiicola]
MTGLDWTMAGVRVLGQGSAETEASLPPRQAQKASAYADPLAWLLLDAVERTLAPCRDAVLAAHATVGQIVVSDLCTLPTMRHIARDLARNRLSPLRFSGACPGLICSVPAQQFRFNGPSLVLSMPPESGMTYAALLARDWLHSAAASHVLLSAHHADAAGHRMVCTLLQAAPEGVAP